MKNFSFKRVIFFWIFGLIIGSNNLVFDHEVYASNIVIGAKLAGEQNISSLDLTNVFIKNGFLQDKTFILGGLVFRKKSLSDRFFVLEIESVGIGNTKEIFYEVANARTGISVLFDVYTVKEKNDILNQISNVIQQVEKFEDKVNLCNKITVHLKERQPLQGKAGQLLIDIKKYLFKNKDIAYINRVLSQSVLSLQDFVDAKQNKSISGHMCPVDILCHATSEGGDKLNIILVRTEDQKELNNINISSENDINKLIVEILKYKKR